MNRKKTFLWAMVTIVGMCVLSIGCGGGGGGGSSVSAPSSASSVISGLVSDGPIQNARVSLDLNHNGKYDDGEPFSITKASGVYRIEYILDPGTEYMLIVEGSTALNTIDPVDNPGGPLDFVMFFSLTTSGSRTSAPSAAYYQLDATPISFKTYLTQIDNQVGGISDASVTNIISSTDDSVSLFQKCILDDGVIKAALLAVAVEVTKIVDVENTRADLEVVGDSLDIPSESALDFTDGKTIQDLSDDLVYQNMTVSVIGDLVVSTPLDEVTAEDVILTNMNSLETTDVLTFTVKPSSLPAYDVSVTPYQSILEIPEFSDIRANDDVVVLGADITATDSSGTRKLDQLLACSVSSDPANFYTGLVYYYFDGSQWVNGGLLTAGMNIRTAPFVVVKTGNITTKTITIEGLSHLDTPSVIITGYMATDSTETVMTLDALPVVPASDTISVKIPSDFIISEVIVVDSELSKVSADGTPSLSLPVTDSTVTVVLSTSLSEGGTNMILDATLYAALKDGSLDQDFSGVGAYIDTKIVYRGIDMFLGLNVDATVQSIINENIDRYLNNTNPVFYTGNGQFDGVTIDDVNHIIEVNLTEQNASITVSWSFAANTVVRTLQRDCTGGTQDGSAYSSTYTFTNASGGLNNVFFEETVSERTNNIQTLSASYEGSAVYDSTTGALVSSKFYQKLHEYNLLTMKTDILYGLADMTSGTMSFNGSYSFNLRSYGAVTGSVNITGAAYTKGYSLQDATYFNNNDLQSAQVLFSASTAYTLPTANPAWLVGVWTGYFTDSCDANDGQLTMSVTATNATWWGQSDDMSRNYGTAVSVSNSTVTLLDNATIWSNGSKISDTRIEGSWSYNGCFGTYYLNKQ